MADEPEFDRLSEDALPSSNSDCWNADPEAAATAAADDEPAENSRKCMRSSAVGDHGFAWPSRLRSIGLAGDGVLPPEPVLPSFRTLAGLFDAPSRPSEPCRECVGEKEGPSRLEPLLMDLFRIWAEEVEPFEEPVPGEIGEAWLTADRIADGRDVTTKPEFEV